MLKQINIMENTLENKGKFFTQYWGQNIFYPHSNAKSMLINSEALDGTYPEEFIELTPLSAITDEDAIEVAKLQKGQNAIGWLSASVKVDSLGLWVTIKRENGENSFYLNTENYLSVDYLRSHGYALPYLDASVDDLVSFGWVKFKEQTT